jgi:hypothetical protein
MNFKEFADSSGDFYRLSPTDQISVVGWYLHVHRSLSHFDNALVRECFRSAHVEPPDLSVYLPRMVAKRPPVMVKVKGGYRLEGGHRRSLDAKYGDHPTTVAVTVLLATLPDKLPDLEEKAFLREALDCYRVRAFRASIVMTWNLAFDHVLSWIVADPNRLVAFNAGIVAKYPKSKIVISQRSDFEDMKEAEIVEVCRTSRLLTKNVCDILKEKLVRRNHAAHPSEIVVTQHQADDTITDLVNNVVLVLI